MPVPTSFSDLSTTVASNSPSGSETPGDGDNHLRTIYALLASIYGNSGNGWSSPYVASSSLPTLTSGTYTPTLTNGANISASTADVLQYMRVGSVVTVSGRITSVDPIATVNYCGLGITLPIATTFSSVSQCGGTGCEFRGGGAQCQPGSIIADTVNNRATLNFSASLTTPCEWLIHFTYTIA